MMSVRLMLYDDEKAFANVFVACLSNLLGLSFRIGGVSLLYVHVGHLTYIFSVNLPTYCNRREVVDNRLQKPIS